jgi:tetratricopeptide (TPR) repeat protein
MFRFTGRSPSLLLPALLLALGIYGGCRKEASIETSLPSEESQTEPEIEPAPEAVIPPAPPVRKTEAAALESPPPEPPRTPDKLDLGLMSLLEEDYREAARSFEAFLSANPDSDRSGQALFYLGLSHALADSSNTNPKPVEAAFNRLFEDFPDSPYRFPAELILRLRSQIRKLNLSAVEQEKKIKELSEELNILKEIDMQRRPSRPPE